MATRVRILRQLQQLLACLSLALLMSPSFARASASASVVAVACGYSASDRLLLLRCSTTRATAIPVRVFVEPGVQALARGLAAPLAVNATRLTPEPPPQGLPLPLEIARCGLAALQVLAPPSPSPLLLNLRGLGLRFGGQGELDGLERVVALDLSLNRIADVPVDIFAGLPGLLALNLSGNLIKHLENGTFCPLPLLRSLDLSGNPMVMTFQLLHLPALESLDASMSVLEVGVFCRLGNLSRVAMHLPLTILQCFVFDSLPSLRELSFAYVAGDTDICFSMTCDPHPVLGKRVPFNYTFTQLTANLNVSKVSRNFFLRNRFPTTRVYSSVCQGNYDTYLTHHNNSKPLTTGCLTVESESPTLR